MAKRKPNSEGTETYCINPEHSDKPAKTRGLCVACYQAARKLIAEGSTDWDKLVKKSRALEARAGGSGRVSSFARWLAA